MAIRTKPEVLVALQRALNAELQAQHQYQLEESACRHLGYSKRAEHYAALYAAESEHAEELERRILFLGGSPDINHADEIETGEAPVEMLRDNISGEQTAVDLYRALAALAIEAGDFGTLTLAQHILAEEETHLLDAEADLAQVARMTAANWLSILV